MRVSSFIVVALLALLSACTTVHRTETVRDANGNVIRTTETSHRRLAPVSPSYGYGGYYSGWGAPNIQFTNERVLNHYIIVYVDGVRRRCDMRQFGVNGQVVAEVERCARPWDSQYWPLHP